MKKFNGDASLLEMTVTSLTTTEEEGKLRSAVSGSYIDPETNTVKRLSIVVLFEMDNGEEEDEGLARFQDNIITGLFTAAGYKVEATCHATA